MSSGGIDKTMFRQNFTKMFTKKKVNNPTPTPKGTTEANQKDFNINYDKL